MEDDPKPQICSTNLTTDSSSSLHLICNTIDRQATDLFNQWEAIVTDLCAADLSTNTYGPRDAKACHLMKTRVKKGGSRDDETNE